MTNGFTYLIGVNVQGSSSVDQLIGKFDKLEGYLSQISTNTSRVTENIRNMGSVGSSSTNSLLAGIRNLALGFGGIEIAKKTFEWAAGMEQTNLSFEVMLHSADKAKKLVADLIKFADITPFNNDEVLASSKVLLAMGVSSDKMLSTLRKIGDVSSGVNAPLKEMASIFGKMKTGVVVHNEDLQQLAQRGIPIIDMLAKKYHTNSQSIIKMSADGKIAFSAIESAFDTLSGKGGMFENMMARQSETLGGKWSTFTSAVQKLATDIGTMLIPQALNFLNNYLIPSVDWITKNGNAIGFVATAIGGVVLGIKGYMLWQGIMNGLLYLSTMFAGGFTVGIKAMTAALAENQFGVIIGLITAFVGVIIYAWNNVIEFRATIYGLLEVLKVFGSILYNHTIAPLLALGKTLLGVFTLNPALISEGLNEGLKVVEGLKSKYENLGSNLSAAFNKGWNDTMTGQPSSKTDALSSAFSPKGGTSTIGKDAKTEAGITNITSGGSKQTTFNIQIGKLHDKIEIHVATAVEGVDKLGDEVLKKLVQVVNNMQQAQVN